MHAKTDRRRWRTATATAPISTPRRSNGAARSAKPSDRNIATRALPPVVTCTVAVAVLAGLLVMAGSAPAFADGGAAPTLSGVIDNLRNWVMGILAGIATLFLTIGGVRYMTAGGDPSGVEKAKVALKSAAVGYALAVLAPVLVSILNSVVGG